MKIRKRYHRLFLLLTIGLFVLLNPQVGSAQEEEIIEEEVAEQALIENEVISLSQLFSELSSNQGDLILTNKTILIREADKAFVTDQIFYQEYTLAAPDEKERKVYFYDCEFQLGADAPLILNEWNFKKLHFLGCTFDMPITFSNCKLTGNNPLLFENCTFDNNLIFNGTDEEFPHIKLEKDTFHKQVIFDTDLASLDIQGCNFLADSLLFSKMDEEKTHYQLLAPNLIIGELKMNYCRFLSPNLNHIYSVDFEGTTMGKLSMFSNQMSTINFTDAGIEKALLIDSLAVENYIGIQNFDFPESNTNIPWDNLKGEKLALFQKGLSELVLPYQAKTETQLSQTLMYNDLVSMYKKLNTLYLDRGDIQSANGSYIEIKQIETSHQEYIQNVNPSSSNYINLLLNRVLEYFSDYATNPGKSVRRAWEMLLFFTFIYMFTFSEWDKMDYKYYLEQFKLFAEYVKNEVDITDIYETKINSDDNLMKEIRDNYLSDRKKLPRVILLFGEPLHFLGRLSKKVVPQLIQFFNFQPKEWSSLKPFEKITSGFLITCIILTFALYVVIVKFINGLILSINSFVLIGFGKMPEKGIAMYISIVEGLIGWFLVTIFTITLFSQVLQGGA